MVQIKQGKRNTVMIYRSEGGKCDERCGRPEIAVYGQKALWNLTGERLAW
ncbi:hypothetical protein N9B34_02335 [Akkermansiaceae bacterium]|nr:hypothetical protein [Akkermansiaceae bacterium]MDB4403914.1 hypothetical protein [Akkermansiaceae bacterium]